MIYPRDKNVSIDMVIDTLKRSQRTKKEELRNWKAEQSFLSGGDFIFRSLNPVTAPFSQVRSILKESAEVAKFVLGKMQEEIRLDPWAVLGKVAMGSFGFGLIVSRHMSAKARARK